MHTQHCSSKNLAHLWHAFCISLACTLSPIVIKICSPCKVLKTFVTIVNLSDINYITNDIFDMLQLEFSPDSDANHDFQYISSIVCFTHKYLSSDKTVLIVCSK